MTKLLNWIQDNLSRPLEDEDAKELVDNRIDGSAFLEGAHCRDVFRDAGTSVGASAQLARLAREIIDNQSKFHFPVTNIAGLPCYSSRLLVREVSRISHTRTNCSLL
jgi:hypothetical protein